jgi:hypothetical protein
MAALKFGSKIVIGRECIYLTMMEQIHHTRMRVTNHDSQTVLTFKFGIASGILTDSGQ